MKKIVTFVVALLMVALVGKCGLGEASFASLKHEMNPEKEKIMISKIKEAAIDNYSNSKEYTEMYVLGTDAELVIFEKDDGTFILADNPENGNLIYKEVTIEDDAKPIGASDEYLFFQNKYGFKFATKQITAEEGNIGRAIIPGEYVNFSYDELPDDEKECVKVIYVTKIQK